MKLQCSLLAQPARSLPTGNSGSLIAVVNTNRHRRYLICPVPFFFYGPAESSAVFALFYDGGRERRVVCAKRNRSDGDYIISRVQSALGIIAINITNQRESRHTVVTFEKYSRAFVREQ